jgi:hypothetical protein
VSVTAEIWQKRGGENELKYLIGKDPTAYRVSILIFAEGGKNK